MTLLTEEGTIGHDMYFGFYILSKVNGKSTQFVSYINYNGQCYPSLLLTGGIREAEGIQSDLQHIHMYIQNLFLLINIIRDRSKQTFMFMDVIVFLFRVCNFVCNC